MRLVQLRKIPEDEDLRRAWNRLVERMERPQIFFTYEWALAVQRAYGEILRPLVFLAYDNSESLCGIAALAAHSCGNELSFLGATTGDYCDFLSLPEHRLTFVNAVLSELSRQLDIHKLVLTNLPADSPTVSAIRQAARQNQFRCFARPAYQCAQISLELLPRKSEEKPTPPRKLRRFLNAMGREGPVRLEHARARKDVEPALDQFILAHVARFLAAQRISNLARPERRKFLLELAKLLSEPGWIVLTRMMANEKAIAWNYGFQFHATWFWYQPAFDHDLEKYSPGFCLLAKIIEEAVKDPGLDIVDLGLGAEEYKERFSNQTRETLHLTLQKSTSRHYWGMLRYRVATLIKVSPKLEAGGRWLQIQLRKVRDHIRQQGTARTLYWLAKQAGECCWDETEILVYEATESVLRQNDFELRPLDLAQLAAAVIEHVNDEATLAYLVRSAQRLSSKGCQGFALVDGAGKFLHFAWITGFEQFFRTEFNTEVKAPFTNSSMLFDYWTPSGLRGRGYCAQAIELLAHQQKAEARGTWICSPEANAPAIRAIEKTGFRRRYSLVQQRTLWRHQVRGKVPVSPTPAAEVSVRA